MENMMSKSKSSKYLIISTRKNSAEINMDKKRHDDVGVVRLMKELSEVATVNEGGKVTFGIQDDESLLTELGNKSCNLFILSELLWEYQEIIEGIDRENTLKMMTLITQIKSIANEVDALISCIHWDQ